MSNPIPRYVKRASACLCLWAALVSHGLTQNPDVIWSAELPIAGIGPTCAVLPVADGGALFAARVFSGPNTGRLVLGRTNGRGDLVNTQMLGTASFTGHAKLADDMAGGAFILATIASAGLADPPLGAVNGPDLLVARVDGSLSLLWVQRLGTSGFDLGNAIESDGAGGAYFAGEVSDAGNFGGVPLGPFDGVVARVTATGSLVFARRYGHAGMHSNVHCLERSTTGGVWCGASGYTSPNIYAGLVQIVGLSASGSLVAARQAGNIGGAVSDIAADGRGGYVYLYQDAFAGTEFVRHDSAGNRIWRMGNASLAWNSSGLQHSVVALDGGQIVLVGLSANPVPGLLDTYLRGIDALAATLWETTYAAPPGSQSTPEVEAGGFGALFLARNHVSFALTLQRVATTTVGAVGCAGQPNSTGSGAVLAATGSALRADDALTIYASGLPQQSAAYFLCSTTSGYVVQAGGSQGNLCLGGAIGRFVRAGEVWNVGDQGRMHQVLGLGNLPSPTGPVSALAGETWHFQAWYRDANPSATSNFTGSWAVPLQ